MPIATDPAPANAEDTRARILRMTFELIGREGIGALTNRRIAAAAGVSLGSLTYHFPSQEELLRECLRHHSDEEARRLEGIAEELRSRRPTSRELAAEIERLAALSAQRPQLLAELELHLQAARDPALQSASRRSFAAYESLATAALAAFGVPDPERHAVPVVSLMMGTGVRQLGTGKHDAQGLIEGLRTIVLGARARESTS